MTFREEPSGRVTRRRTGEPVVEVLYVDDNIGDAELARVLLEDAGASVNLTHCVDGIEALAFLRRAPPHQDAPRPDLILLDLNLPRIDGREVLAEIKRDPGLRRIPVIVLTSSEAPGDVETAHDLGANAYARKPGDFDAFADLVRAIEIFWLRHARLPPR